MVRVSVLSCCMCSTTSLYVVDTIATAVQLGLGHISSALGRGGRDGGPIVTHDVIICPLRG
jgi:hypothetical protein